MGMAEAKEVPRLALNIVLLLLQHDVSALAIFRSIQNNQK
jgi:hypothetical protein